MLVISNHSRVSPWLVSRIPLRLRILGSSPLGWFPLHRLWHVLPRCALSALHLSLHQKRVATATQISRCSSACAGWVEGRGGQVLFWGLSLLGLGSIFVVGGCLSRGRGSCWPRSARVLALSRPWNHIRRFQSRTFGYSCWSFDVRSSLIVQLLAQYLLWASGRNQLVFHPWQVSSKGKKYHS